MTSEEVIRTLAVILAAGLACTLLGTYLRVPRMILLVAAGALLGPSVTGAIDVPLDSPGAELILTLGVSFILFHGGLQLSLGVLGKVSVGLGLLAVPGVVITAAVTGAVAAVVFDLPLAAGLLVGAALAPTDPAILVPLFDRTGLRPKVKQTVIAESALNDPTGAVLALAFAEVVLSGSASLTEPMIDFLVDLVISTALGVVFGVLLSAAVSSHRAGVWRESAAIAVLAVVSASFVSIDFAGGSGYLGPFIAGLIVGNMDRLGLAMHTDHERDMRAVASTTADVTVMLVFLIVGANLPWEALSDDFLPALAVVATLIFLARPLTVLACLLLDRGARWSREELVFIAWTRETGVVATAIAGILVGLHVPNADVAVTVVALAILVTLGLQATTKRWLAYRLGLVEAWVEGAAQPPPRGLP